MKIQNALGILSSEVPVGNLLWVDAINGIDALARRGRMTIPFRSLGAAKAAAGAGDTIMVLPGTYNEKNLLKNNVNWHFFPGAIVDYTGGAAGGIFDTSSNGSNAAVTSLITGYGEFKVTNSVSTGQVVNSYATNSSLVIQGRRMATSGATCIRAVDTSGKLVVDLLEDITAGGTGTNAVSVEGTTAARISAGELSSPGVGLALTSGGVHLRANRLKSTGSYAVTVQGASGPITLEVREISSTASCGIFYSQTSQILNIINCRIIAGGTSSSSGRAIWIVTPSAMTTPALKLTGCVLLATAQADSSIYAGYSSVVQLNGGSAANLDKNGNVTMKPDISFWKVDSSVS